MFALLKSDSSLTTASLPLPLGQNFLAEDLANLVAANARGPSKKNSVTFLRKGWKTSQPRASRCLKKNLFRHSLAAGLKISSVRSPQQTSKTNPRDTL